MPKTQLNIYLRIYIKIYQSINIQFGIKEKMNKEKIEIKMKRWDHLIFCFSFKWFSFDSLKWWSIYKNSYLRYNQKYLIVNNFACDFTNYYLKYKNYRHCK